MREAAPKTEEGASGLLRRHRPPRRGALRHVGIIARGIIAVIPHLRGGSSRRCSHGSRRGHRMGGAGTLVGVNRLVGWDGRGRYIGRLRGKCVGSKPKKSCCCRENYKGSLDEQGKRFPRSVDLRDPTSFDLGLTRDGCAHGNRLLVPTVGRGGGRAHNQHPAIRCRSTVLD